MRTHCCYASARRSPFPQLQNTADGLLSLSLAAHCLPLWEQRAGPEDGPLCFTPPAPIRASAPQELLQRGCLVPSHGAQTAGKGQEAPEHTKYTKTTRRNQIGKGTRRKNQSWVQIERRLNSLCSGFLFANQIVCGTIPKPLGREELLGLVHLTQHPPWRALGEKIPEQSNLPPRIFLPTLYWHLLKSPPTPTLGDAHCICTTPSDTSNRY